MASRLLTLAVWALVLASAVFWALKVFASPTGLPPQTVMPSQRLAMGGELRKLLGTSEKLDEEDDGPVATSDRFRLVGVVEPPKAWRTGSVIEGDTVLLAVNHRSVQLGPRGGPATTELTLPEPTPISAPPHQALNQMGRPVPMMPSGVPGQMPVPHASPSAQPVQRNAPPQQEDEDLDEEEE
jgi:general secretion pathway protein C